MHWAPPAELTRFLEIIRGAQTDERTVQTIVELAQELGKEPGVVNDIPGFVANRIAYAMYREAIYLLEQGIADVETIDLLCRNSLGLWAPLCGPFRWMDITGGPALYANAMQTINPTLCNEPGVSGTMQKMKQEDRRGTATGEGFYTYAPGDAAEWQKKLREHAEKLRAPDSSR
jgi:3-hydroxybutyryl-CoA dehydrogenase